MLRPITASLLFLVSVPPLNAADLKQDLLTAASKGDAAAVKSLLAKGVDVNARNAYGATPLALAADKGHVEIVRLLIEHKANVNSKDTFYGATPLTWAVMRNHAAVAALLVEAGAEGADGVLHSAASRGQTDMVRALLAKKKFKPETLGAALAGTPPEKKEIIELLTKAGAQKSDQTKPVVDNATLASYAGNYRGEQGTEIQLVVQSGKLVAMVQGRAVFTLIATDKTTFKLAGSEGVTIVFSRVGEKVGSFTIKQDKSESIYKRVEKAADAGETKPAAVEDKPGTVTAPANWPSFRGPNASGVADGQFPPLTWDADKGINIRWKTPIPGLGHSCPVIWGGRLFVTTAISGDGKAAIRAGQYGDVDSVEDQSVHTWRVYCLDRKTGNVLWEKTARKGVPHVKRHLKSTHANPTVAVDAGHVVACFGSEGLYCYDHEGHLLWQRDLGKLDSGWFYDSAYQWGFGSSPILYQDRVIVQCDIGEGSFLAAYHLTDGKEVWRTPRAEIPSWGTPTIVPGPRGDELVTNATKFARGYDPRTGKELWRLGRHSEITVPAPIFGCGLIFVTDGYRPVQPIYAIRPGARGDLSLKEDKTTSEAIAWSKSKGGPYLPTPIVYGDYLYVCTNAGIVTCYEAATGKEVYKERLGGRGGYTASPVAADGKLYFTSEEDGIRVVRAGPKFQLLAVNPLGEVCLSTPAICDGMLFVRTEHHMLGIGRK